MQHNDDATVSEPRSDLAPVIVLAGGLSHEREVSLRSGRQLASSLQRQGHRVVEADLDSELLAVLHRHQDCVVFPVLHGEAGEDGSLREVFDLFGVRYVGSSAAACRIAFDKSVATAVLAKAGAAVPAQLALPHETFGELGAPALMQAILHTLGLPLMVKPAKSGSALGATLVKNADQLPGAMVAAYAYGPLAVVEQLIVGSEVTVTVIDGYAGPQALPAVEIRPDSGIYDYTARYTPGATRFLCPPEVSEAALAACTELALTAHAALGLAQLSRTDMIVDQTGTPVFLETNVAPGMTETSALPLALDAAGLRLGAVCSELVQIAATDNPRRNPHNAGRVGPGAAKVAGARGGATGAGVIPVGEM